VVFCQELGQLLILKALFHKAFKIVTKEAINAQLIKGLEFRLGTKKWLSRAELMTQKLNDKKLKG
jgi:hypothetical protein